MSEPRDSAPPGAAGPPAGPASLRERAEARIHALLANAGPQIDNAEIRRLLHELSVHQAELEMRNDDLQQAQAALAASRDRYRTLYDQSPVGFLTLSLRGAVIVDANPAAGDLLGVPAARLPQLRFGDFLLAADRPRFERSQGLLLRSPEVQTIELQLAGPPGRRVQLRMTLVLDDESGSPLCRTALMDVSERVAAQRGRARLAAIVDSSQDAIISRDTAGRVMSWNAAAERMFGYTAAEMLGAPIDAVLPAERHAEEQVRFERLRRGDEMPPFESERLQRDGTRFPVSLSMSPIRDGDAGIIGVSEIVHDIRERVNIEQALRRRLRQLDLLSRTGQSLIMAEGGAATVLHDLFERVRTAIDGEILLNYVPDAGAERLRLAASEGLSAERRAAMAVAEFDSSLCGQAARQRAPLIVEDLPSSALPQVAQLRAEGARCYAGFPLLASGRLYGVVALASTTRDRFGDNDLLMIQTVCDQVSAMLDRSRLIDELRERERALQRADRRKDDFIAMLAHELRNPLAPIRSAVEILGRREPRDEALSWCTGVIQRQVVQMTHLLEDLLDVSRFTRNKIELRRQPLALAQAVEQAVETTAPLLRAQQHALKLDLPAEPIELDGDLTRLTQVFANLLSNAVKFTPPGGHIELALRRTAPQEACVSVRDDGVGIEPAQLAHVFDMFVQFTPPLERTRGGLGIGLGLARGLVQLHGGRIEAASPGPGRGSEFRVYLPVEPARDAAARAAGPAPGPARQVRRRILVVDDNVDAAQTLASLLSLLGQDARAVFSGDEALRVAAQWQPDAGVIDIGMPGMNGYELCRRLREQAGGAPRLLIACTGWGQQADREHARTVGFDHHLVKPIEPEALLRLLDTGAEPAHRPD